MYYLVNCAGLFWEKKHFRIKQQIFFFKNNKNLRLKKQQLIFKSQVSSFKCGYCQQRKINKDKYFKTVLPRALSSISRKTEICFTWYYFGRNNEGDPANDYEEPWGKIYLQQHWSPSPLHFHLKKTFLSSSEKFAIALTLSKE